MKRLFLPLHGFFGEGKRVVARIVFSILTFAFIVYFFFSSRSAVALLLTNVDGGRLALCVLGWSSLHFLSPLFSHRILKGVDGNSRLADVYTTYWDRLPAKYLPGGVWQTIARASDLKLRGLSSRALSSLMVYEIVIPPLFTATMGGALIFFSSMNIVTARYGAIIASISTPILLALPYVSYRFSFKKITAISLLCYLQSLAVLAAFWWIAGFVFFLYLDAVNIRDHLVHVVGAYMSAWTFGYIAIFAPQGIGIAELSLTQLLSLPMTFSVSVTIFAGFRMIILGADLLVWLAYRGLTSGYHLICCGHD